LAFKFDLTHLNSAEDLQRFLGIDPVQDAAIFRWVLDYEPPEDDEPDPAHELGDELSRVPAPFWRYRIQKKNRARGHRIVWEAQVLTMHYKTLARRLSHVFKAQLDGFPHPSTFGFLGGRNIRENARVHAGRRFLLSTDIADFFPTITRDRVKRLFESLGIVEEPADLLSRFVTIGDRLPLGLATSPVISNAVFLPIDVELQALANSHGARYSRYADDCTFSSDQHPFDVDLVERCVTRHGFQLAHSKTRRSKIGQSHYVTGLSVSDGEGPHAPRRMKAQLRQELYYARKFGLSGHLERRLGGHDRTAFQREINRLDGTVKFVAYHENTKKDALRKQWRRLLGHGGHGVAYAPVGQDRPPFHICVDEAEIQHADGRLLALGFSVSQEQTRLEAEVTRVLARSQSDVFAAGNKAALVAKGLHYADANEDLRLKMVQRLETMPFDGFVALARLSDNDAYEATYLKLLRIMLRRRLIDAESQRAVILVEKNNKVSKRAVEVLVKQVFNDLAANNNRRPRACDVQFVSKPHPGVTVPDFLLGVLGRYLKSPPVKTGRPESRDRLMFERIRDKCRLILDVDSGVEYTRRWEIQPWNPSVPDDV
jgi:hypothetical protein